MNIILSKNHLNLSSKEANKLFKIFANHYIYNIELIKDPRFNSLAKYIKENDKSIKSAYGLLHDIINSSNIQIDDENNYRLIISDKRLDKYARLICYGNMSIKGCNILKEAIKSGVRRI